MEKVLLAINGTCPDRRAFDFAVRLCKRIRAGLNILDIIGPESRARCIRRVRRDTQKARQMAEATMAAVAFAEAGEFDTAAELKQHALDNLYKWLPEPEQAGIPCELTITSGPPDQEIVNYIEDHKDVVLTIYDARGQKVPQRTRGMAEPDIIDGMKKKLSTPIVTMRS